MIKENKYFRNSKIYDIAYLPANKYERYKELMLQVATKNNMKFDREEIQKGSSYGSQYNTYKLYFFSSGIKTTRQFVSDIRFLVWPNVPNDLSRKFK